MDKLKPLIKHHYWICFAFAVIFTVVGWWLASGSLAEATTARFAAVEDSFSKAGQGADAPNPNWITAAQKVNEADRKSYDESSRALWQRQKDARIWHSSLQEEIKNIPYNDPITQASTRRKWGVRYGEQIDDLLKIVNPFVVRDGTGLVVVDKRRITHRPYDSWKYKAPTSDEIWKNQEDIWLLKSLLTSLARVNVGASRITEASLREIIALRLRGGDRDFKPSAGGGGMSGNPMGFPGGGGPQYSGDGDAGDISAGMVMGMGMGTGTGAGGPLTTGPWKAFEGTFGMDLLAEEFGAMGGAAGGTMADGDGGAMGAMMMMGAGLGARSGGAATEPERYVDKADALPYKTRAFFLHVRVKEDQVPRLLAELTDSDFPVEIVRVDVKTFGGQSPGRGGMGGMFTGAGGAGAAGMGMGMGGAGDPTMGMAMGMGAGDPTMGMGMGMGAGDPTMGMGMGMADSGDGYAGDGGYGDPGMAMPGMMGDGYGDMQYGGGYGGDRGGFAQEQQTGRQALAAAMRDPMLVELRVAGLMTLYQSAEETVAETQTEAAAAQEAEVDSGLPPAADGDAEGSEGSVLSDSADSLPGLDESAPVADPAVNPANLPLVDPAAASPDAGSENSDDAGTADDEPAEDEQAVPATSSD